MPLHRNIKIISIFNFLTDFRFFAPIVILYFQKVTGSFSLAMSIFSIIFISSAVFEIPTGILSDNIGRKKTIILGAVVTLTALLFYALGLNYWILIVGALFEGLGRSFYSGNNEALLYDTLAETNQESEYHIYLGKTSSLFQIAAAAAALIGGFFSIFSFSLVMWISIIPQIFCVVLSFFIIEPKSHFNKSSNVFLHLNSAINQFIQNRKLRLVSIANMINFGMGNAGFEFQAAFYNLIWPVWALGIARMIANLSGALSYYFSGKLVTKYKELTLLFAESIISPITKLITIIFITPLSPAIMALMSLLYGFGAVSSGNLQQHEFTDQQRATMRSLVSLGGSICYGISAFLLGYVADKWGIIPALALAQIVLLFINIIYVKIYKINIRSNH